MTRDRLHALAQARPTLSMYNHLVTNYSWRDHRTITSSLQLVSMN